MPLPALPKEQMGLWFHHTKELARNITKEDNITYLTTEPGILSRSSESRLNHFRVEAAKRNPK